ILAINQDPKGEQAMLVYKKGGIWLYRRTLSDGSVAVAVMNYSRKALNKEYTAANLTGGEAKAVTIKNIWQHTTSTLNAGDKLNLQLAPHQTAVLVIK
ncbi:MAG: hypothetical protein RLZZ367_2316, partial [Bacteroidota bacterium]